MPYGASGSYTRAFRSGYAVIDFSRETSPQRGVCLGILYFMSNDLFIVLIVAAAIGIAAAMGQGLPEGVGSPMTATTAAENTAATTTSVASVPAPTAVTRGASAIAASTATLHGTVDAHSVQSQYWFEYGPDPLLGATLVRTTPPIPLEADTGKTEVEFDIFGLSPHMTYYFRIVVATDAGVVRGNRASLRTK